MSPYLILQLTPTPYPYPTDKLAAQAIWGSIILSIVDEGTSELLLETQWDIDYLTDWYLEHGNKLCQMELPFDINGDKSLAELLFQMTGKDFDDDNEEDNWFDKLFAFREVHSLDLWFRGLNMPDIIIGCRENNGEVSLYFRSSTHIYSGYTKPGSWAYKFDFQTFRDNLRSELILFFNKWTNLNEDKAGVVRARKYLEDLNT